MLINNIDELLYNKGKTRYWLAKEIGIAYPNMVNLCELKTTSLKFETMERLCEVLEVDLNTLFTTIKDNNPYDVRIMRGDKQVFPKTSLTHEPMTDFNNKEE